MLDAMVIVSFTVQILGALRAGHLIQGISPRA